MNIQLGTKAIKAGWVIEVIIERWARTGNVEVSGMAWRTYAGDRGFPAGEWVCIWMNLSGIFIGPGPGDIVAEAEYSPALTLTFQFGVYEHLPFFDLATHYRSKGRVLNDRDLSKGKSTQKVSDPICLFSGVIQWGRWLQTHHALHCLSSGSQWSLYGKYLIIGLYSPRCIC